MAKDLVRSAGAEALGTGLLVAAVVGSGIMAASLAGGNLAIVQMRHVRIVQCEMSGFLTLNEKVEGDCQLPRTISRDWPAAMANFAINVSPPVSATAV